jgi:hypothetical protein
MRISDRSVAVLAAAGFTGIDLGYASSLLMSHAIGSALTVSAITASTKRSGVPVSQTYKDLESHLDRLTTDHPNYRKWWQESGAAGADPEQMWDEGFMFGLERLLDGLEMWLDQRKRQQQPA